LADDGQHKCRHFNALTLCNDWPDLFLPLLEHPANGVLEFGEVLGVDKDAVTCSIVALRRGFNDLEIGIALHVFAGIEMIRTGACELGLSKYYILHCDDDD